jgi:hypothetical protein
MTKTRTKMKTRSKILLVAERLKVLQWETTFDLNLEMTNVALILEIGNSHCQFEPECQFRIATEYVVMIQLHLL